VRLDPGGLRLCLPLLRQRAGRLETQFAPEEIVEQVGAVERLAGDGKDRAVNKW